MEPFLKIIQKSDPSFGWVWATVCLRPGQNKGMDVDVLGRQFILMPVLIVCMWYLLWQTVYTDARAYLMHVVYLCMFYHIYFTRYDFKTLLIWFI